MLRKSFSTFIILTAVLCVVYSQGISAQAPAPESAGQPVPVTAKKPGPLTDSPDVLEEVVVTGRYTEGSGRRRRSAVSREDLDKTDQTDMEGFFDDIDGLSTLGGDDQGNAFSIDGLGADLSKVTLNGQGFGQGRGSGGFGAGDLPPDMIRRVEIYKTPTASMEEGGSGGNVNLQLRNPVEIAMPSSSIKGRLAYVPEKGNLSPSANFFSGASSESRKFGYMLNVTLSDRVREYDSQNITNWVLTDFEGASAYMPSQIRNSVVKDDQRTMVVGTTLGFRPHRSLDISARLFLSRKNKDIETRDLQHRVERQRIISVLDYDDRMITELESSDPGRKNLRIVGSTREEVNDSLVLGLDFNWRRAKWRVGGALGYVTDTNKSDSPSQSAVFEANSAFGYRADNQGGLITFYPEGFPLIPEFEASRINLSDRRTEDTDRFAGLDLIRQLGKGFFRRVSLGGKFRKMERSRRGLKGKVAVDDDLNLADFFTGQYEQTLWDTVEWPGSDMDVVNTFVKQGQTDWQRNPLNDYEVERQTEAAYLQADFRSSETRKRLLVGNMGVRVVNTKTAIAGFQVNNEVIEPVFVKTSETDILPSLGMRVRVAERSVLTLGLAKVMTHPSFNDLAPGIRINYSDKTARSGNPYLEPFRASQFLAEITWVPARGRRLTANMAYRDVESYFALGEESVEIDDDTYLVTRPINGEDGYILSAGVKLDQNLRRLARWLQNFTFSLSYIYNKSGTEMQDPFTGKKLPMPNTAEQVGKVMLKYSKNNFGFKLSYQRRGESLRASVSESGLSVWNQPTGSLNLNLGWRLNNTLQLSFDARNLLNEAQVRSTDYDSQIWRISERNRSIAATLHAKW